MNRREIDGHCIKNIVLLIKRHYVIPVLVAVTVLALVGMATIAFQGKFAFPTIAYTNMHMFKNTLSLAIGPILVC